MRDVVRKDILDVMEQVIATLEAEDHHALSELSNHVIHDASIFQDDDSISFAVLVYALGKVVQRFCEKGVSCRHFAPLLKDAKDALEAGNNEKYRLLIKGLFDEIKKHDDKLRLYTTEVLDQARIKKGSSMHEHGISLARTAELLGISQWELQDYIGKTRIPEHELGISAARRLKTARSWFK